MFFVLQRPRRYIPSYTLPNISINDSFTDNEKYRDETYVPSTDDDSFNITDNEKHRDETYVPSTDDDTENNLNTFIDNYLDDSPHMRDQRSKTDTETQENTLLSDSVATSSPPLLDVSNIIIGVNEKILANDSNNSIGSIIENSDYTNELEQSRYPMYIPPSETDESYHTITCVSDSNIPNSPKDNSSVFDDSDRDATYNPASEDSSDSSSVTSYTEEMDQDVLNDTQQNQQLSLGLSGLEKPQVGSLFFYLTSKTIKLHCMLIDIQCRSFRPNYTYSRYIEYKYF